MNGSVIVVSLCIGACVLAFQLGIKVGKDRAAAIVGSAIARKDPDFLRALHRCGMMASYGDCEKEEKRGE